MRIIADENIPYAREAFGRLGEVTLMAGREISRKAVRRADALFVRSVTRVNADLLEGTRVQFVATATIGTDHIDVGYLSGRRIGFAYAPGSNANSVAEYVTAALLVLAERRGWKLADKSIGVVGVGNVGSRVVTKARALGMRILMNDPPLARRATTHDFVEIDAILEADVVTLHVPLTKAGEDKTFHLVDGDFLGRMRSDATFVNTSRGAVVDCGALLAARRAGHPAAAVLDVWENEPRIDVRLLKRIDIGTAHVAGYSLDGKVDGTRAIYRRACEFFGKAADWNASEAMPAPATPDLTVPGEKDDQKALAELVRRVYDIELDDALLRDIMTKGEKERGEYFDHLRKTYAIRREFQNTVVRVSTRRDGLERTLSGLGFGVERVRAAPGGT